MVWSVEPTPPFVRVSPGLNSLKLEELTTPPVRLPRLCALPAPRPSRLHIVCLHVAKNGSSGTRLQQSVALCLSVWKKRQQRHALWFARQGGSRGG